MPSRFAGSPATRVPCSQPVGTTISWRDLNVAHNHIKAVQSDGRQTHVADRAIHAVSARGYGTRAGSQAVILTSKDFVSSDEPHRLCLVSGIPFEGFPYED